MLASTAERELDALLIMGLDVLVEPFEELLHGDVP
jgi:hypothetical protein